MKKFHEREGQEIKSIESEILNAMSDFSDALRHGDLTTRFTCRQITLNLVPARYTPALVKKTRKVLGLSQPLFARFLGVSANTVKAWEQGKNIPETMACRFMDEIRTAPAYWIRRLQECSVVRGAKR